MTPLVSLEQAKAQIYRLDEDTSDDFNIEMKILQASAIVLQYYKVDDVPEEWYAGSPAVLTVPYQFEAATLLVFAELYANREASAANILSDAVKNLIPRTPTLA